jgi:hypothetical protein
MDQNITDAMLLNAVRQRVLEDIKQKQAQHIINNIVGGHGGGAPQEGASSVFGQMANRGGLQGVDEDVDPAQYDYNVDILKEDLYDPIKDEKFAALRDLLKGHPEIGLNPKDVQVGKPRGWKKSVRRYKAEKKGDKSEKKK